MGNDIQISELCGEGCLEKMVPAAKRIGGCHKTEVRVKYYAQKGLQALTGR